MSWPHLSSRNTIERRLMYIRFADPEAIQVYQGMALGIVGLSLLCVHAPFIDSEISRYYAAWPTTTWYAVWALAVSMACLIINHRPGNRLAGTLVLAACCVYWCTMWGEVFARFGFVPLSHGLIGFLAVMACYGAKRLVV